MPFKTGKTFKSYFAWKLFSLFTSVALIPSALLLLSVFYIYQDTEIERNKLYQKNTLKQYVMTGFASLNQQQKFAREIGSIFETVGPKQAKTFAKTSGLAQLSYSKPYGISTTLLGSPIELKAPPFGEQGDFEASYIAEELLFFSIAIDNSPNSAYVIGSLPLFSLWEESNLSNSETICILINYPAEYLCASPDKPTPEIRHDIENLSSDEYYQQNRSLFVPGFELEEKINFVLITEKQGNAIKSSLLTSILTTTVLTLILSWLAIKIIRKVTRPIDSLNEIEIVNTPGVVNNQSELERFKNSYININDDLNNKVTTLSAIKNLSEAALKNNEELHKVFLANLPNLDIINTAVLINGLDWPSNISISTVNSHKEISDHCLPNNINLQKLHDVMSGEMTEESLHFLNYHIDLITSSKFNLKLTDGYFWLRNNDKVLALLACSFDEDKECTPTASLEIAHYANYAQLAFSNKIKERQLTYRANYDPLTGLLNRDQMNALLTKHVSLASETEISAFLFIDLDNFKNVNDTLGHIVGDSILKECAETFLDLVQPLNATLSRFGGDEFTLFTQNIKNKNQAIQLANTLIKSLDKKSTNKQTAKLSASIGVVFPNKENSATEILRRADIAMYHAKSSGRSRVAIYTEKLNASAHNRAVIEQLVRKIDSKNDIKVHYQAKVDREGNVSGFEALVRFNIEDDNLLSPQAIIQEAERNGKIHEMGVNIFTQACEQYSQWEKLKIAPPSLAINISPYQLEDTTLPSELESICQHYNIKTSCIELEITESQLIDSNGDTAKCIQRLGQAGFLLAVDDFGTGYSCFSYLANLPFSRLKVDRSFVVKMEQGGKHKKTLASIISTGASLGLKVTVEGIETAAQAQAVFDLGCDDIQGFLYSPAVPADMATKQLQQAPKVDIYSTDDLPSVSSSCTNPPQSS